MVKFQNLFTCNRLFYVPALMLYIAYGLIYLGKAMEYYAFGDGVVRYGGDCDCNDSCNGMMGKDDTPPQVPQDIKDSGINAADNGTSFWNTCVDVSFIIYPTFGLVGIVQIVFGTLMIYSVGMTRYHQNMMFVFASAVTCSFHLMVYFFMTIGSNTDFMTLATSCNLCVFILSLVYSGEAEAAMESQDQDEENQDVALENEFDRKVMLALHNVLTTGKTVSLRIGMTKMDKKLETIHDDNVMKV